MHPLPYYNSFICDQIENLVLATSPQTYDGKVDVLSSLVTCDNWVLERKKQKKNHDLMKLKSRTYCLKLIMKPKF